jgi:F-type H+-transporting ATPase subunit b
MAQPAKAQTVTSGTEVPASPAHSPGFPPLDPATFAPQLIWLALTFGLLYLLLSRLVLPRIGEVIEERSERIARDLEQAETLKLETERALADYEKALADARGKANAIAKSMRDTLTAEIDKERGRVEAQIADKVAQAEASIAQTKQKALASVNDIAADTATAIVAKLIGTEVTRDEVQRAMLQRAAE